LWWWGWAQGALSEGSALEGRGSELIDCKNIVQRAVGAAGLFRLVQPELLHRPTVRLVADEEGRVVLQLCGKSLQPVEDQIRLEVCCRHQGL